MSQSCKPYVPSYRTVNSLAEEDAELKENGCVDLKKYQWNC